MKKKNRFKIGNLYLILVLTFLMPYHAFASEWDLSSVQDGTFSATISQATFDTNLADFKSTHATTYVYYSVYDVSPTKYLDVFFTSSPLSVSGTSIVTGDSSDIQHLTPYGYDTRVSGHDFGRTITLNSVTLTGTEPPPEDPPPPEGGDNVTDWTLVKKPFEGLTLPSIMDMAGNVASLFTAPTTAAIGLGVGLTIVGFVIAKFMH